MLSLGLDWIASRVNIVGVGWVMLLPAGQSIVLLGDRVVGQRSHTTQMRRATVRNTQNDRLAFLPRKVRPQLPSRLLSPARLPYVACPPIRYQVPCYARHAHHMVTVVEKFRAQHAMVGFMYSWSVNSEASRAAATCLTICLTDSSIFSTSLSSNRIWK